LLHNMESFSLFFNWVLNCVCCLSHGSSYNAPVSKDCQETCSEELSSAHS